MLRTKYATHPVSTTRDANFVRLLRRTRWENYELLHASSCRVLKPPPPPPRCSRKRRRRRHGQRLSLTRDFCLFVYLKRTESQKSLQKKNNINIMNFLMNINIMNLAPNDSVLVCCLMKSHRFLIIITIVKIKSIVY